MSDQNEPAIRANVRHTADHLRGVQLTHDERDFLLQQVAIASFHLEPMDQPDEPVTEEQIPAEDDFLTANFTAEQEPEPGSIFSTPKGSTLAEWANAVNEAFVRYGSPLSLGQEALIRHALSLREANVRTSTLREVSLNLRAMPVHGETVELLEVALNVRDGLAGQIENQIRPF